RRPGRGGGHGACGLREPGGTGPPEGNLVTVRSAPPAATGEEGTALTNEQSDTREPERRRPADAGETLGAKARAQAERLAEPLRHDARLVAERQKEHGAERLVGLASAMHRAAQELEPQLPQTAACIHDFAGGVERISSSLRAQSVEDITQKFTTV